jgi:hypothetical protein
LAARCPGAYAYSFQQNRSVKPGENSGNEGPESFFVNPEKEDRRDETLKKVVDVALFSRADPYVRLTGKRQNAGLLFGGQSGGIQPFAINLRDHVRRFFPRHFQQAGGI